MDKKVKCPRCGEVMGKTKNKINLDDIIQVPDVIKDNYCEACADEFYDSMKFMQQLGAGIAGFQSRSAD